MKHVISSFALAGLLFGAVACTTDDDAPDVDVTSLDLDGPETRFEVIIVRPDTPRRPTLALGDLPAKASPADLSFGADYFVGGARLQTLPAPGGAAVVPDQEFDTSWQGPVHPVADPMRPTFPDQQFLPPEPGPSAHQQVDPRIKTNMGQETDLPQELDDPCLCTGQACLTSWVDANIGCDVCAVFVCGEATPHACNSCQ